MIAIIISSFGICMYELFAVGYCLDILIGHLFEGVASFKNK